MVRTRCLYKSSVYNLRFGFFVAEANKKAFHYSAPFEKELLDRYNAEEVLKVSGLTSDQVAALV